MTSIVPNSSVVIETKYGGVCVSTSKVKIYLFSKK